MTSNELCTIAELLVDEDARNLYTIHYDSTCEDFTLC